VYVASFVELALYGNDVDTVCCPVQAGPLALQRVALLVPPVKTPPPVIEPVHVVAFSGVKVKLVVSPPLTDASVTDVGVSGDAGPKETGALLLVLPQPAPVPVLVAVAWSCPAVALEDTGPV